MALFSRRPAATPAETPEGASDDAASVDDAVVADTTSDVDAAASQPSEITDDEPDFDAVVGISMSSFQGLGAPAPAVNAAEAAGDDEADAPPRPGLQDNGPLVTALAKLPERPEPAELLQVARQLLQGHLFLRVKGDAKRMLAEGENIPLAITTIGDKQYVLVYSGVAALRASLAADGATDTSAMAQPAQAVLRFLLSGTYAGLIVDPASAPARAMLSRELIAQMMEQADPDFSIKKLLSARRTESTPDDVVAAIPSSRLWIAVNKPDGSDQVGVAEARTADGDRLIEVFTHPIEIAALGRGDRPAPVTGVQLGAALRADPGLAGILIDPAGPWIRLDREDLAPLMVEAPGDGD
ncbi:SseB family protein [Microbacterium sp. NPDC076895]|uniref:SseB family protein n=1 Tax=Microbacterium sp. NPDC076895 TaxID=3154957 RepID=UPI003447CF8E